MYCKSCGEENVDGAKFCKKCGTSLAQDAAASATNPAENVGEHHTSSEAQQAQAAQDSVQQQAQGQAQQQAGAQQAQQGAAQGAAAQQQAAYQQQQQQAAQQQAYQQQATYQQVGVQTNTFCPTSDNIDEKQYTASPFSSGWADIEHSKGWFPRSLLLGLCAIVPVLRWVVSGFAVRWGREICLGINRRLPTSIFEEGTFLTGAKIWVVDLIYCIALFTISCILFLVPIIGPIIIVLGWFAFFIISPLLSFQVGLSGKISAGFSGIARSFKLIAKAPIKTLASTLGPSFILEAVVGVVAAVFMAIMFLIIAGTTATSLVGLLGGLLGDSSSYSHSFSGSTLFGYSPVAAGSVITTLLAAFTSSMIVLVIIGYAFSVAAALAEVWMNRSLGHLIARVAPEWLSVPGLVDLSNVRSSDGVVRPYVPFSGAQPSATQTNGA